MSRIGKLPISIPAGVTITHKDDIVTVKGPKGELSQYVNPAIKVTIEDRVLTNFSMRVGESIALEARPLNGAAKEGTVVWSMSDKAASALRFIEDKTDPWKVTLECFNTVPASVNIYVELDGVKSACVIYPN